VTQALTHTLVSLVSSYGLLGIFVLMAAESCGLPFPSEVIMPVGGALVAAGHLQLAPVILAGAVGNLVGSLAAYWLAAQFGPALLLGPGRWVGFSRSHLELAQRWFTRYGLLAVFLGRVMPVVRTYISFPAGLARIKVWPFSVLTLIGALPWCAALTAAGYLLGANWERISRPIELVAIGVAVLVAMVVVVWFVRGRSREPRAT
jgi:membrane protein DedA with SNARE-associated domain